MSGSCMHGNDRPPIASALRMSTQGLVIQLATSMRSSRIALHLERWGLVLFDFVATYVAFYFAAWGRQSWDAVSSVANPRLALLVVAILNVIAFSLFHLYSSMWRFASVIEALRIAAASIVGALIGSILFDLLFNGGLTVREYVLAWALFLIPTAGVRLTVRALFGVQLLRPMQHRLAYKSYRPRTLIVGAGQTGSLTIKRMLLGDEDMWGLPVALVDDDPSKRGLRIHGIKVRGGVEELVSLAEETNAEQIVVACPSATVGERQRIFDACLATGLKVLALPNVRDIPIDGIGRIALREIDVADLLAREEVILDAGRMGYIRGKVVLVTGGGGSIGSELVRQLVPAAPSRIIVFDNYENTAYELFHELTSDGSGNDVDLRIEIGSVTDERAIRTCFEEYRPDVVFHAAARKHVPLMESNPREAIVTNVFGTRQVALLAQEFGCSHFVLISTDKAVNPENVMGATKRMCELEVQSLAASSTTVFTAVRFGNVLGSHGSVIPLFRRQLKSGGPITLTHPDITRYFMTIPEAARLVITAGALASGGEIFILKMGDPVKIYDLAVNLIKLSGLKLHRDIEIEITGLRPGEKLYEELQTADEHTESTAHDDILITRATPLSDADIERRLAGLRERMDADPTAIKRSLAQAVPTYHPHFEQESDSHE